MNNNFSVMGDLILQATEDEAYIADIIMTADDELEYYKEWAKENNWLDFKSVNERASREILAQRALTAMKSPNTRKYDFWKKICCVIDFSNSIAHAYRANVNLAMGANMFEEAKRMEKTNFYEKNGSIFSLAKLAFQNPNQIFIGLSQDEQRQRSTLICDIPTVGQVAWHTGNGVAHALNKFYNVKEYPFPIERRGRTESNNIQVLDPTRGDRLSMHNIIVRDSKSYEEMIKELSKYYFPKRKMPIEFE